MKSRVREIEKSHFGNMVARLCCPFRYVIVTFAFIFVKVPSVIDTAMAFEPAAGTSCSF